MKHIFLLKWTDSLSRSLRFFMEEEEELVILAKLLFRDPPPNHLLPRIPPPPPRLQVDYISVPVFRD